MNQENSENCGLPIIGEDIPWKTMLFGLCRVTRFTPFAHVIKEQSQSFKVSGQVPYASLAIEIFINYEFTFTLGFIILSKDQPHLPTEASMPIWNRVDFINLWEVFREADVTVRELESKKSEVLVTYKQPEFDPDTPSLTIGFYAAGSLENIVFPPPGTTYPRFDTPKSLYEWDENKEEEFQGDIFGNIWKSLTHTNHIYGNPFLHLQGHY